MYLCMKFLDIYTIFIHVLAFIYNIYIDSDVCYFMSVILYETIYSKTTLMKKQKKKLRTAPLLYIFLTNICFVYVFQYKYYKL